MINISGSAAGVYLIKLRSSNTHLTTKFIIK
ncbi:T9SS type A sorting domain-containing protein [Alkalitalea saponilacus]